MAALLIGYARCSTDQQDRTTQRDGLLALDVDPARIYADHGLPAPNRDRPGSAKHWRPAARATHWCSPSWTGSLGLCLMLGRSPTS